MTHFRILVKIVLTVGLINASANAAESIVYPTAILGAFEEELTWLENKVDHPERQQVMGYEFVSGEIEGQLVVLALTGVGKVNAAIMTTLLLEHFEPRAVIFSGVAGGINPDRIPGDVVIGTSTIQHDLGDHKADGIERFGVRNPLTGVHNPVDFHPDSLLLSIARGSIEGITLERSVKDTLVRNPEITFGVIATGDAFITSTPKKAELHQNLKASAVEMEGAAVAQVCYQLNVPCLVIRGISDFSDENAEQDFEKYYQAAARNANRVVIGILEQMHEEKSKSSSYKDEKYGFVFEYPAEYAIKLSQDPDGGLIYAALKNNAGEILVSVDLFDLSSYPQAILASEAASFQDAARYVAELTSGADGPDGSRYCSGVDVIRSFQNPNGIDCLELSVTLTLEDYNANQTTTEMRAPVFMLDLSPVGKQLILIVEPYQSSNGNRSIIEEIVASVQL